MIETEEIIWQAATQVVTFCVAAACGWFASRAREASSTEAAMRAGMKAILRKELVDAYEKHVTNGSPMSVERRHEVEEIYKAYAALGGNGTGKAMYDKLAAERLDIIN